MKKIPLLPILWVLALLTFVFYTYQFQEPSSSFWGVVQSEKTVIRSPESGEIRMLRVNAGDSVQAGDTLLVLFQPEIGRQQTDYEIRLRQLQAAHERKIGELKGEIRLLHISWQAEREQVEENKRLWEARQARDSSLALPWLGEDQSPELVDSVLELRRKAYETELANIAREHQAKLKVLNKALSDEQKAEQVDRNQLQNDLDYWTQVGSRQVIRAPHDGWVGEVMVSDTELTLKGVSLVEIWSHRPHYVEGYIHETFSATLEPGQSLDLLSSNGETRKDKATLVKLGNRIVEFPRRLRKSPEVSMWGREVIIRLDEDNPFLIGEKVMIQVP